MHDLPAVGENLQDHLEVYVQYTCKQPVSVAPALKWRNRPSVGAQWLLFRRGPGATNHFEARRLHPLQRGRRLPEPDVPLPAGRDPLRRLGAAGPRLPGPRRADVLRRPRLGQDQLDRPAQASGAAVQLPVDRPGPARVGRGDRASRARSSPSPRSTPYNDGELSPGPSVSRPTRRSSTGSAATPRPRCTPRARARWASARTR